jgi:pteridine reductase
MGLALVTGAGVRVGRAVAEALAEAGYDLVLHAHRSGAAAREVAEAARAQGRESHVVLADLAAPEGVEQLAGEVRRLHGALDVLVNSAGAYESARFDTLRRAEYTRMLALNLEAPFFLTQALLPLLLAAPTPSVVNITDSALERPYPRYAHYMVSKAGLAMLTRALALELAPRVRVNAVAPGTVAFPESFDPTVRERILARIPLGREGTAADIGHAVVFLVRDAPYITGHTLDVDGGARLA